MNRVWTKASAAAMLLATAAVLSINSATAADGTPDATLTFSGTSAAVGVGATWGNGTLHFRGKDYAFRLRGVNVADIGVTKISATGNVYNLARVVDFAGNYAAVSAGAALTGGGGETAMRNDRGVVVRLRADTEGVQLKAAVEGVVIELESPAQ